MLLENVQKLMKIHTTNQAFNTTTYEVLEWNVQKKRRTWPKIKTSDFDFFKKLIGRFTMIKHCDLWTTWSVGINKLSLSTYQVTFILYIWKLIKYRPWPDRLCLWWKIAACYFLLVIYSLFFRKIVNFLLVVLTNNKQKINYFLKQQDLDD